MERTACAQLHAVAAHLYARRQYLRRAA